VSASWDASFIASFVVFRQSVYIGLGDYQTLLRPLRRVQEEADDEGAADDDDERQVLSTHSDDDDDAVVDSGMYGDDTLRAIAVITQKYDSFKRRQARKALMLNKARQLYKNISMLFLFPVKDGKLNTGVNAQLFLSCYG